MLAGELTEALVLRLVFDFAAGRLGNRLTPRLRLRYRRHRTGVSIAPASYMGRLAPAV